MWFVFPQIAGLGVSPAAVRYAIPNIDVATLYLRHDVLGPRLIDATTCVLTHRGIAAEAIFGAVDAMKFRSSMTLFSAVPNSAIAFRTALQAFYDGAEDDRTLKILSNQK